MWLVNPKLMCDKHLLGEHVEMHMFVGAINKGHSIDGFVTGGLVETSKIASRHDELAWEMVSRMMRHVSSLPDFEAGDSRGSVDVAENVVELSARCVDCKKRIVEAKETKGAE